MRYAEVHPEELLGWLSIAAERSITLHVRGSRIERGQSARSMSSGPLIGWGWNVKLKLDFQIEDKTFVRLLLGLAVLLAEVFLRIRK